MRSAAGLALAALLLACRPASAEILLEAFMGRAFNRPSDFTVRRPAFDTDLTFSGVSYEDKSFKPSPYYGYRVVNYFDSAPWLGLSLEFLHLKAFAETGRTYRATGKRAGATVDGDALMSDTVGAFAVTHGLNFLTLNVQARRRMMKSAAFPGGRFSPYAGLGAGAVIPFAESVVEGRDHDTGYFVSRNPGMQAFAGGRLRFHRRWLVFTEYKFTRADLRIGVDSGTASARFEAHNVILGVGFVLRPSSP